MRLIRVIEETDKVQENTAVKEYEYLNNNRLRAVKLENGFKFGVFNSKTNQHEYFEFEDGKFYGLYEDRIIDEFGQEVFIFYRNGEVYDQEYIMSLSRQ